MPPSVLRVDDARRAVAGPGQAAGERGGVERVGEERGGVERGAQGATREAGGRAPAEGETPQRSAAEGPAAGAVPQPSEESVPTGGAGEQEEAAAGVAAHEVAREADVAAAESTPAESTPAVGAEPDPLAPVAQRFAMLADADAATASALVRGRAAARRAGIAAHFAARRAQLEGLVNGASERIGAAVLGTAQRITGWLGARVHMLRMRFTAAIQRITTVVTSVAASIQTAANAVVGAVTDLVSGAVERVMDLAQSLPIPDVPLIGRVRGVVLGAARRIAGVITGVVANVGGFATSIVGFVLSGITGLAAQIAAVLLTIVERIAAAIANAVARITARLAALRRRVAARLTAALRRMARLLVFAERAALAHVGRMERSALQRIEANRRRARAQLAAIMAFVMGGPDYPADDGTWGPLDAFDSAVTKAVADAGALGALAAVAEASRLQNAFVLARFEAETSNLVALALGGVAQFVRDVAAQVAGAVREVIVAVAATAAGIVLTLQGYVTSVIADVTSLAQRIGGFLRRILSIFGVLIGNPRQALRGALGTVLSAVRGFVTRLIDGLISFLRRAIGSGDASTEGVTSGLEAFSPARLAAVAGMASVPIAIGGAIAAAAGATLAMLTTILFWTAVIGLILMALVVLYKLVEWVVGRVRAKPVARPVPRVREQPKVRPKRRRRRRTPRRFFWNPRANSPAAVASGGLPGAVDVRGPRQTSTPQGHHVWPKFVGGPDKGQPMFGARLLVHQAIHREFPLVMGPVATTLGTPLTPTTLGNAKLIRLLRTNDSALVAFTSGLTLFYAGFNRTQVHPAMPAAAFLPGLAASAGVIRASRPRGR